MSNNVDNTRPATSWRDPDITTSILAATEKSKELNRLSAIGEAPVFRYDHLACGWIRVLDLQPGTGEEPIICSISAQPLGQRYQIIESFEAVSYVWGNPTPRFRITCNWRIPTILDGEFVLVIPQTITNNFEITGSLQKLLFNLRRPDAPRRLWIDQICIDQSNEIEKGDQIRAMSQIYAGASRVLIWLGSGDEVDDLDIDMTFAAMDLLSIFHDMSLRDRASFINWLITGEQPAGLEGSLEILSADGTVRPADEIAWRNRFMRLNPIFLEGTLFDPNRRAVQFEGTHFFTDFLQSTPWFRRAWTFQESIMGYDPVIMYGKYSRSWEVLYRACQTILSESTGTVHGSKWTSFDFKLIAESVVERGNYRKEFARLQIIANPLLFRKPLWKHAADEFGSKDFSQSVKQWRLKRLLPKIRSTDATEPVDKVLALLGIAQDDGRKILFPNKKSQVELLYLTVAKYWITTGEDTGYGSSWESATEPLAYDDWPCPLHSRDPELSLLSHVQVSRHRIPSWVPDWSCSLKATPLISYESFCASGDWREEASIYGSGLYSKLHLKGLLILTIHAVNSGLEDFESQATMIYPFCNPYPTTTLTYRQVYSQLTSSVAPETIRPPARSPVCPGFWQYVDQYQASQCSLKGASETNRAADAQCTADDLAKTVRSNPTSGVYKSDEKSLFAERALFISTTGFLGLAPKTAMPGDTIYLLAGARVPFALRGNEDGSFQLLGECYAFGLMHGEAISGKTAGRVEDVILA